MKKSIALILLLAFSAILPEAIRAGFDSESVPHPVPKMDEAIVVDGILSESVWETALKLELPYETDPGENIPALVKTQIMIYYDQTHVYFGLICHDPNPSEIRARFSERDNIFADDIVNINLDTFNDERRNYYFGCNPFGVQRDGIETLGGNPSWDAIWDSAGKITDIGYTIEIAIPFSSFQFQRKNGPQVWGLDISRWYQRSKRHRLGLVQIDRNNNSYQSQFLKIIGFEGVKPGENIEVIPTMTGINSDERESIPEGDFQSASKKIDPGITVRWGLTSNIALNGTANPDFSQVEADSRQLDINQPFALFYQEKRPFFTEGNDFFRSPFNVIYTRTLRDPVWGLKLTGKEGANTMGAYYVKDDLTNLIFPRSQGSSSTSLSMHSNAGVFRYKRDFGSKYTLGTAITSRAGEGYFNRVFGLDGEARITNRNKLNFQFLGSSTKYPDQIAQEFSQSQNTLNDRAFLLDYRYQSRSLNVFANYQDVGAGFRADLGFLPMVNFRRILTGADYGWINSQGWWSELRMGYRFLYTKDHDGSLLQRRHEVTFFFRGAMQSFMFFIANHSKNMYMGAEYEMVSAMTHLRFQPSSNLQVGFDGNYGDRIDYANSRKGKGITLSPEIVYNLGVRFRLTLSHSFERMTAGEGRLYTANISQGNFIYHLSSKIYFRTILQYVNYDYNAENYTFDMEPKFEHFFTQLLFSYRLNPRTVLFLGYSDNYLGNQAYGLTQTDRTIFLKIGYSWQF